MPPKIDLEREFFNTAKDLLTKKQVKEHFMKKVNQMSEEWIDNKFRMGFFGLKDDKKQK